VPSVKYVYEAVVVLHFLGLASLVGGFLVQLSTRPRGINRAMLDGAMVQVVTGLLLVMIRESADIGEDPLNHTKIGVKLLVAFAVAILCLLGKRRPEGEQQVFWAAAGGLALANIVVAVFW
jgi:hypothetical protein